VWFTRPGLVLLPRRVLTRSRIIAKKTPLPGPLAKVLLFVLLKRFPIDVFLWWCAVVAAWHSPARSLWLPVFVFERCLALSLPAAPPRLTSAQFKYVGLSPMSKAIRARSKLPLYNGMPVPCHL